jgi:hypothetical protein
VYQPWIEQLFMLSPQILEAQIAQIALDFQVGAQQQQGMTAGEYDKVAPNIPEPMRSLIAKLSMQRAVAGAIGPGGGNGAMQPATAGAIRAGQPGSAQPGGPQPQEALP